MCQLVRSDPCHPNRSLPDVIESIAQRVPTLTRCCVMKERLATDAGEPLRRIKCVPIWFLLVHLDGRPGRLSDLAGCMTSA